MTDTKPIDIEQVIFEVKVNRRYADKLAEPSSECKRLKAMHASGQPFAYFAANENFTADELPTSIPADKAAMRDALNAIFATHPIRVFTKEVATLPTLETLEGQREEILLKARSPIGLVVSPAVSPVFMTGKPANDNREPQSWPLAEQLRRDDRHDDILVCELYRGLASIMTADPLQGRDANLSMEEEPSVNVEHRGSINGYEESEKTGDVVGTGEIQYKGVRQVDRTPGVSTKAVRKGDGEAGERYRITTAKFSERTLIAQIDSRGIYARLRAAIRPLLGAFEDACLDGATMTEIGLARHYKDKQASAAGKALVYEAIGALTEEWRIIRLEENALEQKAEVNVIRYRAKRNAQFATFMGLAA